MSPSSTDPRAKRWATIARYAALLGVGFLVAPYVFTAITGLIGLAVAAGLMGLTWVALPWVETTAGNLRLSLVKAEAARDPIGTLEQESLRKAQALNERKDKIEALAGKTASFHSKLDSFKRDYPQDAASYQEIYDKMMLLLKRSRAQWVLAEGQLDAFDREITRAKAKWAMALAASDLRKDAGQVESEFMAKIKVECSFDTIETGMNSAFAQLDTLLMESDAQQALPSSGGASTAALPAASGSVIDADYTTPDAAPVSAPSRRSRSS